MPLTPYTAGAWWYDFSLTVSRKRYYINLDLVRSRLPEFPGSTYDGTDIDAEYFAHHYFDVMPHDRPGWDAFQIIVSAADRITRHRSVGHNILHALQKLWTDADFVAGDVVSAAWHVSKVFSSLAKHLTVLCDVDGDLGRDLRKFFVERIDEILIADANIIVRYLLGLDRIGRLAEIYPLLHQRRHALRDAVPLEVFDEITKHGSRFRSPGQYSQTRRLLTGQNHQSYSMTPYRDTMSASPRLSFASPLVPQSTLLPYHGRRGLQYLPSHGYSSPAHHHRYCEPTSSTRTLRRPSHMTPGTNLDREALVILAATRPEHIWVSDSPHHVPHSEEWDSIDDFGFDSHFGLDSPHSPRQLPSIANRPLLTYV